MLALVQRMHLLITATQLHITHPTAMHGLLASNCCGEANRLLQEFKGALGWAALEQHTCTSPQSCTD